MQYNFGRKFLADIVHAQIVQKSDDHLVAFRSNYLEMFVVPESTEQNQVSVGKMIVNNSLHLEKMSASLDWPIRFRWHI